MRVVPEIVLTNEERAELTKLVRSKLTSVRLAQHARIVLLAAKGHQSKPKAATRWSTRTMAAELGVSATSVSRHWRKNGLKPHLVRGFKVSRDPKFVEKLEDIVGLYMSPPGAAVRPSRVRWRPRTRAER